MQHPVPVKNAIFHAFWGHQEWPFLQGWVKPYQVPKMPKHEPEDTFDFLKKPLHFSQAFL